MDPDTVTQTGGRIREIQKASFIFKAERYKDQGSQVPKNRQKGTKSKVATKAKQAKQSANKKPSSNKKIKIKMQESKSKEHIPWGDGKQKELWKDMTQTEAMNGQTQEGRQRVYTDTDDKTGNR